MTVTPKFDNFEDATKQIIQFLKERLDKNHNPMSAIEHSHYGYDLYIPSILHDLFPKQIDPLNPSPNYNEIYSPIFYDAAWFLCKRGILRPGVTHCSAQSTNDESGFSLTWFGKNWLRNDVNNIFIPDPSRYGDLIDTYCKDYGNAFCLRAHEAMICYEMNAYLACCVMCGASSESILLSMAIKKTNDKDEVYKKYQSAGGTSKIKNLLIGSLPQNLKNELDGLISLMKYWRDESGHGDITEIGEIEAYTSLSMLLRLAMFCKNYTQKIIE